jgi:hypothetical protein
VISELLIVSMLHYRYLYLFRVLSSVFALTGFPAVIVHLTSELLDLKISQHMRNKSWVTTEGVSQGCTSPRQNSKRRPP